MIDIGRKQAVDDTAGDTVGDTVGETDTVSMSKDLLFLTGLGLTPLSLGSCSSMFTEYSTYNYFKCVCVHFEVSHTQMYINVLFVFICFVFLYVIILKLIMNSPK